MSDPALSVVVAVKDGERNLPAILAAVPDRPDVELIVAVAGNLPTSLDGRARVVTAPADALVPHLWRDGILAARAPRVALTTGSFIPGKRWVETLLTAPLDREAGVGGVIANDPAADAANWAVYFLRYNAFAPPRPGGMVAEVAADNALYDRAAILAEADLLARGFWEPGFHARFRAAGRSLRLDPAIEVVHHGLAPAADFVRARHAHGRHYGRDRAGSRSKALAFLLASPLVPAVTLGRVVRRVGRHRRYRKPLLRALPWLTVFALAWSVGEAHGYWDRLIGAKGET